MHAGIGAGAGVALTAATTSAGTDSGVVTGAGVTGASVLVAVLDTGVTGKACTVTGAIR